MRKYGRCNLVVLWLANYGLHVTPAFVSVSGTNVNGLQRVLHFPLKFVIYISSKGTKLHCFVVVVVECLKKNALNLYSILK